MNLYGFFITCTKPFLPTQILELSCPFSDSQIMDCKIEVRHANEKGIGTRIIDIHEKSKAVCARFLEEHCSDKLNSHDSNSSH